MSAGGFERFNNEYGQQESGQQNPQARLSKQPAQAQTNKPTFVPFNSTATTASDTAAAPPDTADPPSRGQRNAESQHREDEGE